MRKFLLTVLLFVSVFSLVSAQRSLEPLRLTIDVARFRGPDDSTMSVEIYYSFPQRGLTYVADSNGFGGGADVTFFLRLKDSLVYADRWIVPHHVADTASMANGMNLIGLQVLPIPPGEYILKAIIRDKNQRTRVDSTMLRIPIRLLRNDRVQTSDLEFASSIHPGAVKTDPFYKNTLSVVPNIGGLFSEEQRLYYYLEVYNLYALKDESDFTIKTLVQDAVGKDVVSREKTRKRPDESTVLVDNIPVAKLHSGTYTLTLTLVDSAKGTMAGVARKFFVYNQTLGGDSSLLAGAGKLPMNEFMSMDEAELDRDFRASQYETTDVEKKQYASLAGVEPKRKMLSELWRRRPLGQREEYMARVQFANANYRWLARDGYKTDRGRVHVMYGPPDDIERHPNETDTHPYEIWSYNNIQGGVIFVFVQKNSTGDYELVHSTHRNELHDENWDRVGITR